MNGENSSRLSRRAVLAGLGLGATAVGAFATPAFGWAPKPAAAGSGRDRRLTPLSTAGMEQWSRQIGTDFAIAGGTVVRLARVEPLGSAGRRPAGVRDQAFAAVFEPVAGTLPTGDQILDVSHAQGGAMKIYFSACTGRCAGARLQAIFA
jgi:hypothetical protein